MSACKKWISFLLCTVMLISCFAGCKASQSTKVQENSSNAVSTIQKKISFTDDDGRKISLDAPCKRIISLYSPHTENLFSLGLGSSVIGVSSTSVFPPEAAFLKVYDYESDPEKIIAANPDLLLIRPFISKKAPDFIKAIENAGITVVSLYPESFDGFDAYIEKLALLTGTEETAKNKLVEFHKNLNQITELTKSVNVKKKVFFESTETNLRTVTPDSMPAKAIAFAGGDNVAKDVKAVSEGSSIAAFGNEKLLSLAEQIDVYVSQRGAMNAGGDEHSISIRPGFDTIKAVREKKIFLINEKLVSAPTFRYVTGVWELARYFYPEILDSLDTEKTGEIATKREFARILVKGAHLPVFVPSSSKYYKTKNTGHTYGLFEDLKWDDSDFNMVETAVQSGAVSYRAEGDKQYFDGNSPVTREEAAKAVFILGSFKSQENKTAITDIDSCKSPKIVQNLVDQHVFTLNNGKFEPQKTMTTDEMVALMQSLKK